MATSSAVDDRDAYHDEALLHPTPRVTAFSACEVVTADGGHSLRFSWTRSQ